MTAPASIFAIVYADGRAETLTASRDYWGVLDMIYIAYQSAGGNWNRPSMLLHNGKVVVESGLADIAWKYGQDRRQALNEAGRTVRERHTPDWLCSLEQDVA